MAWILVKIAFWLACVLLMGWSIFDDIRHATGRSRTMPMPLQLAATLAFVGVLVSAVVGLWMH